jgi:O-antigen ligase
VSNPSPLFGAGLGRYEFIDAARPRSEAERYTYPHNILAEAYHATGLIGLGLIGLAMGTAIVLVLRACMARATPLAVLMAVPAFTAMAAMTGGNLYDARLLWIVPVAMAALARPNPMQEADA